MKTLNEKALFENFADLKFSVKDSKKENGRYILEYNYPDDQAAVLMRKCFLEAGAEEVSTYYKILDGGILGSRERAILSFDSEDDLRNKFIQVLTSYVDYQKQRVNPSPKL